MSSEHLEDLSRKEDHKSEVNLGYRLSSRPARGMDQDCLKRKKQEKSKQTNPDSD